jgi:hypothetical protein
MLVRCRTCMIVAAIWAALNSGAPAHSAVVALPLMPGVEPSSVYRLYVHGTEVPVGRETTGAKELATAAFQFSGPADVRIVVKRPIDKITIRPLRFGLAESAAIQRDAKSNADIRFQLDTPRKLVVEIDSLPPLVLIGSPPDSDLPNPNDPNVIYFKPGVHRPGRIRVKSNQTVFLDAGAKVYGTIEGSCVENVRITGRGHLYGTTDTNWQRRTYAIVFDRCHNITIEKIGIRDCYWWTTEFLLCRGVQIRDINLLTFNRNNGGLMIDSCSNLVASDSLIMTRDDCICPHALNAAGNGEDVSDNLLFEDLVLYNVVDGNGIRIGASFETREVRNWTFRKIDVVERCESGAAVLSDHSDWAIVRNLVFQDFVDEGTTGYAVDIRIDKTRYSCQTGYRDERGAIDRLYFVDFKSMGGKFSLKGFDMEHEVANVLFAGCWRGEQPIANLSDIIANAFVTNVRFEPQQMKVDVSPVPDTVPSNLQAAKSPDELIVDNDSSHFRSYGFSENRVPTAYQGSAQLGQIPYVFGKYAAAIYEPRITGQYDVFVYCDKLPNAAENAPWIVRHGGGYTRAYVDEANLTGWHSLGTFLLDASSDVRLVIPDYFDPTDRPVVADAVKFVRRESK